MNKNDYDRQSARLQLARQVEDALMPLLETIIKARRDEMDFASNDSVDAGDFDNLRIKAEELIKAARTLQGRVKIERRYGAHDQKSSKHCR